MDIPLTFRWVFVALVVLQLVALVPVLRRLCDPAPERRTEARLRLLDAAGSVTFLAGFALDHPALVLSGLVCVGAVYAAKGVLWYRARERT
ncbi:hypothetical protein AWI43_22115 [Streptomyces sp. WAC04657]|uniref:hypothetical protein n=1 Tax=unclassified Streptomyces TaxID=2593676 RepID=UPI000788D5DE|nr:MULTISPECIES: hypothetical protein [unclassified Streptomyces]KYG52014.1 hypothetical protein AWI43_22115 [Streptomyces sp. WAC04657]